MPFLLVPPFIYLRPNREVTEELFATLSKQVALKRLIQKQNIHRQTAALAYLHPLFVRHLKHTCDYKPFFLRAIVKELRHCTCDYHSLMEIIEASGDFDAEVFFEFAQQAALLAGIDLVTDNSQDFWKAFMQAKGCEQCSLAYRGVALSACCLLEPFPFELVSEICHSGDLAIAHFFEPMNNSLDALIPPKDGD